MLVVIQPKTLPCTVQELQKIEGRISSKFLFRLGIPGAPASVEEVVTRLSSASIAHFACQGHQNIRNPLDSFLILENGAELKVSRIMQQSMPNASLAFLCACETAMGETLPEEAIHLSAMLLFAGFRGVVATMW
jgi:CHAT domain-containing protein